jgi:integrase
MPRKNSRAANGAGAIRKRSDGRWESRITVGRNPATGQPIRKSLYAPTQGELVKLVKQAQAELEQGTFIEPNKLTVASWADIWMSEYLGGIKESTQASYMGHMNNHIKPALGAVQLQKLTPHEIQKFYNRLSKGGKAAKTIKNIHGVLHSAMEQAIKLGYVKSNPTTACTLPRIVKPDVKIMEDDIVAEFLNAIQGDIFEAIFFVDLFSGMRQSEILGLPWENVNFNQGTILINQQLVKSKLDRRYYIDTTKHDKIRIITPAPMVMEKLKLRKAQQEAEQNQAGDMWRNEWNLVFTNEAGRYLVHHTVRKHYKKIVAGLGAPNLTFHGMRHSYAVISIIRGDDPRIVQENLGHHTAAFTLDTYVHTTSKAKKDSANRMEQYIKEIMGDTE